MGKADEKRLAIGVQKYSCLYDKAVSAIHNKNQTKDAREAVAKDIGLETGEAAKNAFKNAFAIMSINFDFGAIAMFLLG